MRPFPVPFLPDELKRLPQRVTRKKIKFSCLVCGREQIVDSYLFNHTAGRNPRLN